MRPLTIAGLLTIVSLPCPAGSLTAVIPVTDPQGIEPACREALTRMLEALDLAVLPKETDPVQGDIVVPVVFEGAESPRCELETFVNPTGLRLAKSDGQGPDRTAACTRAVEDLRDRLSGPLKKLRARGLPQVVALRWSGKLRPPPDATAIRLLKKVAEVVKLKKSTPGALEFHLTTKLPPGELRRSLTGLLAEHYRIERVNMGDLPRSPRTHWFMLKKH